jgi:hypothetical protein
MRPYSTYIFCTPEVSETPQAFTVEIATLLDGVKSNHSFYGCGLVPDKFIEHKKDDFNSLYRKFQMQDFFEFCKRLRDDNNEFQDDSFVVLLTNKENTQKYFSATDGKNIYINVKDLELYSLNQSRYPIAFQILENIFQAICGIVYHDDRIDERLHSKSIGCINDVCRQKSKIINKLKSVSICENCRSIAKTNDIMSDYELEVFNDILESIKTPLVIKFEQNKKDEKPVIIDRAGNIFINGEILQLENLIRSIYIFFLIHNKGMTFDELGKHVNELAWLYQKIKNKGKKITVTAETNIEKVKSIILSGRHNQFDPTFYRKISELNNELKKQLNPNIVDAFLLRKDQNGIYMVKVDPSKIEVHSELIHT